MAEKGERKGICAQSEEEFEDVYVAYCAVKGSVAVPVTPEEGVRVDVVGSDCKPDAE